DLLAEGFDIDAATPETTAERVVDRIVSIRDALGLPSQLREIDDMEQSDLPDIAEDVHTDGLMPYCPEGLDPTARELEDVLRDAW
ncbi:MAG: alcohol dehydrogenase class IV, partial [Natronomonas sp.]